MQRDGATGDETGWLRNGGGTADDPNETIMTGCFRGRKCIRLGSYLPGFMAGSTRIRGYLLLIDRP